MVMEPVTNMPQFIGGGPTVFEKNTFIDIDDVPRPPELDRCRTAPPDCSCELFSEDFSELQVRDTLSSSSSSTAAEERGDRSEEFEEIVFVRRGQRKWKLSDEEVEGLGELDVSEEYEGKPHVAASEEYEGRPSAELPILGQQSWAHHGTAQQPLCAAAGHQPPSHHRGYGMAAEAPVANPRPNTWNSAPTGPEQPVLPKRSAAEAALQPSCTASGLPQPQTLAALQTSSDSYQITWTVDARKLKSNDKQAVSPPFELAFEEHHGKVPFKMMIYPKNLEGDGKGLASFKKSNGRGIIQLKCEGDLSNTVASVSFQLTIGNAATSVRPLERRPESGSVQHNFAQSAVCGLPKISNETWDLNSVVDQKSMTFNVNLTIKTQMQQLH